MDGSPCMEMEGLTLTGAWLEILMLTPDGPSGEAPVVASSGVGVLGCTDGLYGGGLEFFSSFSCGSFLLSLSLFGSSGIGGGGGSSKSSGHSSSLLFHCSQIMLACEFTNVSCSWEEQDIQPEGMYHPSPLGRGLHSLLLGIDGDAGEWFLQGISEGKSFWNFHFHYVIEVSAYG